MTPPSASHGKRVSEPSPDYLLQGFRGKKSITMLGTNPAAKLRARWCEHCGDGPWHREMRAKGRPALKSQGTQAVGTFSCLLARHWLGGGCVSRSIPGAGIWAVALFVHQHTQPTTRLLVLPSCLAADTKDCCHPCEMETHAYHRKRHVSS